MIIYNIKNNFDLNQNLKSVDFNNNQFLKIYNHL